mgnify:CR=1 FL=1
MPDYSKSIIYKLCCKDISITDIYVGSTCNFTRRKSEHKKCCHKPTNYSNFYLKVYKFIRENGGWDNWDMIMLEQFSCENKRQKEMKEREWIEKLKATLNMCIPTQTIQELAIKYKQKYTCQCGSIIAIGYKLGHEISNKHLNYKNNLFRNKKKT